MIKRIIIFDTETTGLLKPKLRNLSSQPQIIEYCFRKVFVDDETHEVVGDEKLNGFLNPGVSVPPIITKITGITDADLAGAPKFIDKLNEIAHFFLGTHILVAHNLPFDRSMLANELLRLDKVLNFPWPERHICTVESSISIKGYRLSLSKLYDEFFSGGFNAHRACDDVEALSKCFFAMLSKGIIKI